MKKHIYILFALFLMLSCSVKEKTTGTNYSNKSDIAVFTFESNEVRDNLTYHKNGMKVTYDFWGETVLVILENISDSTLFIDLDKSILSTGNEKLNYNKMIKGNFKILPLLPDSIVELHNFYIVNNDNVNAIDYSIKEISKYKYKQKYFKKNEYPISLSNSIIFSAKSVDAHKYSIANTFNSVKINIITETQFYELQQYNKELYNKTYYNKSNYQEQSDISWNDVQKDIFVDILTTFVEVAVIVALNFY